MALPLGDWLRVSLLGNMAADNWSINLWFRVVTTAVPTSVDLDNLASFIATDFDSKVWSVASFAMKANNAPYVSLTGCRVLSYHDNVLNQSATHNITPVVGTGTSIHPPYVALVYTLLTGLAGRRNRGRIYMPATAFPVSGTTGQLSASLVGTVGAFATFLNNRTSWPGGTWLSGSDPIVMTQTGATPQKVTSVRLDSKFDTQRGRESKLVPSSQSSATVT